MVDSTTTTASSSDSSDIIDRSIDGIMLRLQRARTVDNMILLLQDFSYDNTIQQLLYTWYRELSQTETRENQFKRLVIYTIMTFDRHKKEQNSYIIDIYDIFRLVDEIGLDITYVFKAILNFASDIKNQDAAINLIKKNMSILPIDINYIATQTITARMIKDMFLLFIPHGKLNTTFLDFYRIICNIENEDSLKDIIHEINSYASKFSFAFVRALQLRYSVPNDVLFFRSPHIANDPHQLAMLHALTQTLLHSRISQTETHNINILKLWGIAVALVQSHYRLNHGAFNILPVHGGSQSVTSTSKAASDETDAIATYLTKSINQTRLSTDVAYQRLMSFIYPRENTRAIKVTMYSIIKYMLYPMIILAENDMRSSNPEILKGLIIINSGGLTDIEKEWCTDRLNIINDVINSCEKFDIYPLPKNIICILRSFIYAVTRSFGVEDGFFHSLSLTLFSTSSGYPKSVKIEAAIDLCLYAAARFLSIPRELNPKYKDPREQGDLGDIFKAFETSLSHQVLIGPSSATPMSSSKPESSSSPYTPSGYIP